MNTEKIAIIIPTLSRADYVKRLLECVSRQTILPQELIIVDGGPIDISNLFKNFKDINIKYIASKPPSLTRQRNFGISKISDSVALVGFIDDDIVLEKNCLKNMLKFWETADSEIGGASFNNINPNDSFKKANILEHIFFINSRKSGKLLKSGFNSQISSIEDNKYVDWLFGGITVWRRKVVEEFKFDEWFTGNAFCDDIDYSHRVGKKYKLTVVKEARVYHLSDPLAPLREYALGKTVILNKLYFVKKNPDFSLALCYWACFGLFLGNLIRGILKFDNSFLKRAGGNFIGLSTALIGNKI